MLAGLAASVHYTATVQAEMRCSRLRWLTDGKHSAQLLIASVLLGMGTELSS